MTDLISKQAAINTTFNMCCRWDGEDRDDLRNMMLTAFQDLPTIDPVKHGKWDKDSNMAFFLKCSECGAYLFWRREEFMVNGEPNYCPNCGASMDKEEEDDDILS